MSQCQNFTAVKYTLINMKRNKGNIVKNNIPNGYKLGIQNWDLSIRWGGDVNAKRIT
jgi:hypothetical protein